LLDAGRLLERPLTVPDLARADGLALVSSLRGWRPATVVG
jgi:para-aminobenzoate synthetase/4-amino-4-deoxychorismate lyase